VGHVIAQVRSAEAQSVLVCVSRSYSACPISRAVAAAAEEGPATVVPLLLDHGVRFPLSTTHLSVTSMLGRYSSWHAFIRLPRAARACVMSTAVRWMRRAGFRRDCDVPFVAGQTPARHLQNVAPTLTCIDFADDHVRAPLYPCTEWPS
jgi:hypothetical protein